MLAERVEAAFISAGHLSYSCCIKLHFISSARVNVSGLRTSAMQMLHDANALTYREVIGNYVNVRYKCNYTHGGKSKYLNKRDWELMDVAYLSRLGLVLAAIGPSLKHSPAWRWCNRRIRSHDSRQTTQEFAAKEKYRQKCLLVFWKPFLLLSW